MILKSIIFYTSIKIVTISIANCNKIVGKRGFKYLKQAIKRVSESHYLIHSSKGLRLTWCVKKRNEGNVRRLLPDEKPR